MKVNLVFFQDSKIFEARKIWIQMGGAYLVTWTVLCFQFHTHQSLQNSKASRYFQTVAELRLSVHDVCSSKPSSFAQIKIDLSAHARIFTAGRYTIGNRGFKEVERKSVFRSQCSKCTSFRVTHFETIRTRSKLTNLVIVCIWEDIW